MRSNPGMVINKYCICQFNLDNPPVVYKAQQHTWMTSKISTDWFKGVKLKSHFSKNLPMKASQQAIGYQKETKKTLGKTSETDAY